MMATQPDKLSAAAQSGNASNPSPETGTTPHGGQLLSKEAEKYLREAGNIEDMPDAQDEDAADKTLSQNAGA